MTKYLHNNFIEWILTIGLKFSSWINRWIKKKTQGKEFTFKWPNNGSRNQSSQNGKMTRMIEICCFSSEFLTKKKTVSFSDEHVRAYHINFSLLFKFTCIEFSRICLRAISRSSRCRSTSNGATMDREVFVRFSISYNDVAFAMPSICDAMHCVDELCRRRKITIEIDQKDRENDLHEFEQFDTELSLSYKYKNFWMA